MKVFAIILALLTLFSFSACAPTDPNATQQPSQRPTLTEAELNLLKNRTGEEIINSASNTPYHQLITQRVDSSAIYQLYSDKIINTNKPIHGGGASNPMHNFSELTIEELNKIYPIQCVRKYSDSLYYAMYLSTDDNPIYVWFDDVNMQIVNCFRLKYSLPAEADTLKVNNNSLADFLEYVPELQDEMERYSRYVVHIKGSNKIKRFGFGGYSLIDTPTIDSSTNFNNVMITSIEDLTRYYEILAQDYPQ